VHGRRYAGHRFTFNDLEVGSSHTLDSLVRRFWTGTRVAVHYDPTDPSSSVLDINSQFRTEKALLGGGIVVFGLFMLARVFGQRGRRGSAGAISPS
jgi:hypothetical protein